MASRGDVFWVDFNPARGSEQAGRRPAVIISADTVNRVLSVVTVAAITTKIRMDSPLQLFLPAGHPTPSESAVLGFQVMTVDQARLSTYIGRLSAFQLAQLNSLLIRVWDLAS